MEKFVFLDHTADVKFRAFGRNVEQVFEHAADAMFAVMQKGEVLGKHEFHEKISVEGKDLPALLYNFLEELIYLLDTKDFFLRKIPVKIKKIKSRGTPVYRLEAEALGGKASEQETSIVVKAVTYNQMVIKQEKGVWTAVVVLDV